jgi:phenylalanyl-tRNA synthetase alpha chain
MNSLSQIVQEAEQTFQACQNLVDLQQARAQFLGKKGQLTELLKQLGSASAEERSRLGQELNLAKQAILESADKQEAQLKSAELSKQLDAEAIDVTLPGRGQQRGSLHPVTRVQQRIEDCFNSIGFSVAEGPEIEDPFHNFEALNMPDNHPARDMQDTFYFANGNVLRTHTSSVQIRTMENNPTFPIKIIAPGRVYRSDSDQTHTPMFNQVEGLLVDEKVSFADLKSVLEQFMQSLFGHNLEMRFRPSFFPFTEPSAEVDIRIMDKSHPLYGRWLEVLGCGMVHPHVLKAAGIDDKKYNAWAFGVGMDRLAMLLYGIDDLRMMFESDIRFLKQF